MTRIFDFDINVDVNEMINSFGPFTHRRNFKEEWIDNNQGKWFSIIADEMVIAGSYHLTQQHSATVFGNDRSKCIAPPGVWSVAYVHKAPHGNRSFYDFGPHLIQ